MNHYFIPLAGEAATGKDTAALIISDELSRVDIVPLIISLSDPIKEAIEPIATGDKEKDRPKWQDYGNSKRKENGSDYFAKFLVSTVNKKYYKSKPTVILIPDLRLPEEFEYFKTMYNSFFIKMEASDEIREERMGTDKWKEYKEKSEKDSTEQGIKAIPINEFDSVINNDSNKIDILQYNLVRLIDDKLMEFISGGKI